MEAAFNNLLIPVDFSLNTEIAIRKAISLVGTDKAVLHLIHVLSPRQLTAAAKAKNDLEQCAWNIRENHDSVAVKINVLKGHSVQHMIIEWAKMLRPDMIIIAKQNERRKWFSFRGISPDVVAHKTNCPVLTAKLGSVDSRTKVIVIPVRNFLPERKLEWAVFLARKFKAQIHLLAIRGHQQEGHLPQVFLHTYHRLREHLHNPIECFTAVLHNPAKAVLRYAEQIMADMVLVDPEIESGVGGFGISRHISDLLGRDSKLQILDVEPYIIN
jgi:nucleotide-binding universal stress UspA family protein